MANNKSGTVQTLINLPSRTYQAGTFTSPTYTVQAGVTEVTSAFTMSPADVSDPAKSLHFECDRFDANSQTWLFDHSFDWVGGGLDKLGNPAQPSMSVDGLTQGTQLRAVLTTPTALTTAILVTAQ
jgi:hypothetical protein